MSTEQYAIDILEIVWVVMILTGLSFGAVNLISAIRERKVVNSNATAFGLTLLNGNLAMVAVRTIAQVALLAAGVAALIDPGHPCATTSHRHLFDVIEGAMFIAGAAISVNSVIGWDMRRRLTRLIAAGDDGSLIES